MAGIGFALRRLSQSGGISGHLAALGHGAVVATGPWLFTIISLSLITLLTEQLLPMETVTAFRIIVIYAFAVTLIITAPVVIVAIRLVADFLYAKNVEQISTLFVASLVVAAILTVAICVPACLLFFDLPLLALLSANAVCVIISLIWVALAFCGTVRDFNGVTLAFLVGLSICIVGTVGAAIADLGAVGMLWGFIAGLVVTFCWLASRVLATFPQPVRQPLEAVLKLVRATGQLRYLSLGAMIGALAIWIDKWIVWTGPLGQTLEIGLVHAPLYDSAMFVAYLSIIPSMATFVVHLETSFFGSFQTYYRDIENHATLKEIEARRSELAQITLSSLNHSTLVQLSLCVIVAALAPNIIDLLGFQYRQTSVLRFGAIGAAFQFVFLACSSFLIFFNRTGIYLLLQILFLVTNSGFTWIAMQLGANYYGFGYLLACVVSSIVALAYVEMTLARLNYLTFIGNNPALRPS